MGEPRVLILRHSFIRRLNSFTTGSTHHRFMIHEVTQFNGMVWEVEQLKKLFAVISTWRSRLLPILWYYSWELMIFPTCLILLNFRGTLISRKFSRHISQVFNFVIAEKNCVCREFNFPKLQLSDYIFSFLQKLYVNQRRCRL